MLLSMNDEFQKNQSKTVKGELVTATSYLTGMKDAVKGRDWGAGKVKIAYFYVTSAAAFNPGTSGQVQIIGSDTAPVLPTTDGTNPVTLADSGAIAVAKLVAGAFLQIGRIKSGSSKRFLAAKVTVVGGNATTGALVCGLTTEEALMQTYGDLTNSL